METVNIVFAGIAIMIVLAFAVSMYRRSQRTPEEVQKDVEQFKKIQVDMRARSYASEFGSPNPMIICPQCQTKGGVRTKSVERKKGLSGAKATGALLTGGLSILATGLSRKEGLTQAHCDNCSSTWDF